MNSKLEHIIFDFDGTLWNSSFAVRISLKNALNDKGYTKLADNLPDFEIGKPMEMILKEQFKFGDNEAKELAKYFRAYLLKEDLKSGKFYEGIEESLNELVNNGYKISIATYKREKLVNRILEKYNIKDIFHKIKGLREDKVISKTQLVQDCISLNESKNIMIGDTISDYQAALDNKIEFYLVSYGYGYENLIKKDSKNLKILNNISEIKNILKKMK